MSNNPNNLILGGGKFLFNTTLPTTSPNLAASYSVDFGNVKKITAKVEADKKEHFGTYSGILLRDRLINTKRKLSYEVDLDELSPSVLSYYMGAATGSAPQPGKIFTGFGWLGVEMEAEPITSTPAGIFIHHSFQCDMYILGDLAIDPDNFSSLKMMVDVRLGTPGIYIASARPIV